MKSNRKFLTNKDADVSLIGAAVAILVTIMVSVLIVYNIASSIDAGDVDTDLQEAIGNDANDVTYAANATMSALDQSETFYVLAPLIVIVLIAVTILGYIVMIGKR